MSDNFFNVGNAIESLQNAKNSAAEQQFQNRLEDIQDTANEKTTFFGDIEKGSGTLLGGIAGSKAVISGIKTIKSKISEMRGKKTDEGDEAETAETGETDAVTDLSDLTPDLSSLTQTVQNAAQNVQSTLSNGMEGLQNTGRNLISDIQNGVNPSEAGQAPKEIELTDTRPQEMEMQDMAPQESEESSETLGRNVFEEGPISSRDTAPFTRKPGEQEPSGDQEEEAPGTEKEDFPDLPDADESGEAGIAAEDPAAEFGGTQAESLSSITTDTTLEGANIPAVAAETGLEVGAEVADTAVSTALDATGILAPIGIALQIFGLVSAGAGVAAGIIGSDSAQQQENKDTQSAQSQEAAQKATPANVAGKIAPAVQSQLQRSVGGY